MKLNIFILIVLSFYLTNCKKEDSFVLALDQNGYVAFDTSTIIVNAHVYPDGDDFNGLKNAGIYMKDENGNTFTYYFSNYFAGRDPVFLTDTICNLKRGASYTFSVFAESKNYGKQVSKEFEGHTMPYIIDSITPKIRRANEYFFIYGKGFDYFGKNSQIYFHIFKGDSIPAKIGPIGLNKPLEYISFYADSTINTKYYTWIDPIFGCYLDINKITVHSPDYKYSYSKIEWNHFYELYTDRPLIAEVTLVKTDNTNYLTLMGGFGDYGEEVKIIIDNLELNVNSSSINGGRYYHNKYKISVAVPLSISKGEHNVGVLLNGYKVIWPEKMNIQ